MTSPALPVPPGTPSTSPVVRRPLADSAFGRLWPEEGLAPRPRLVVAAVLAGLVAAVVLPFRDPGLGTSVVLLTVSGVVAAADRRLRTPYHLTAGLLCTLLVATVAVRDAQWIVVPCLLAAGAVGVSALVDGRSTAGLLAAGFAIPLAPLRGLPWLGRSVAFSRGAASWVPAARTVGVSAGLALVFGLLFASADAVFASWAGAVVPDVTVGTLFLRAIVAAAFAGLTLSGAYVAVNPPRVEQLALPQGIPVTRPFEWLMPVGAVAGVFAVFVAAQLTAMFGGHAYVRRTTGLTYAEYVHQGFGQLTCATVLTLAVVAVAARKAPRASARDRLLLRGVLGGLCLLTLVVVASALTRMHVYEEAYGFTRLRLLVSLFEGWLGLVVLLVLVAGLRLRGGWVPRAVLLTGAASLLALAAVNPDAWIARHNLDRFAKTQKIDTYYLAGLSADAVPALVDSGLDPACLRRTASFGDGDWLEWNLGRRRAAQVLPAVTPQQQGDGCPVLP